MALRTPADIARETLKLLAARRLTPTPEHYQAVYEEVAGLLPQIAFPQTPLRRIATMLPTQTPAQKRITQQFTAAVEAQDWLALQSAIVDYAQLDLGSTSQAQTIELSGHVETAEVLPPFLAEQLARLLEATLAAVDENDQRMHELTEQLAHFLRVAPPPLVSLAQMLHNYSYRLSFTSEDQAQRRHAIHDLLHMVGQHIAALAKQDTQLQQHAQSLSTAMDQNWSLQQLDRIQTHLKNLLLRHLEIEGHRLQTHEQLKDLLAQHTQQMAHLGQLSDQHASALQACAQQIQASQNLGDLTVVLEAVVDSGRVLATENRVVQAKLLDLQEQTKAQEEQILLLTQTLHEVQESTRHDPETGALNLQGFQEVMRSEASRAIRSAQPTALACLQLEYTEQLSQESDALSAALVHLSRLARSTLRPQDALARIAGHQVAILFPDTTPNQAAQALDRLRSHLQQRPVIFNEQLLTFGFGAGVIAISEHESPAESLQRAVAACDQAQRMGTSKVTLS